MEFQAGSGMAMLYDMTRVPTAHCSNRDHELCELLGDHGDTVLPRYAMLHGCDRIGLAEATTRCAI